MARIDFGDMNTAALGEAPVADSFYELGMMYSIGRSVPIDYVTAHKWFNLAAMRGNEDARACAARSPTRCRKPRSPRPSAPPAPGSRRIDLPLRPACIGTSRPGCALTGLPTAGTDAGSGDVAEWLKAAVC